MTIQKHKLQSYMASYYPLDLLKPEYQRVLPVTTRIDGVAFVALSIVAEFFISNHRVAIDKDTKHKQDMVQLSANDPVDTDYKDIKGQI